MGCVIHRESLLIRISSTTFAPKASDGFADMDGLVFQKALGMTVPARQAWRMLATAFAGAYRRWRTEAVWAMPMWL